MSKLGHYIHYNWANYEKYGNFVNQSQWHTNKKRPRNNQPSDFDRNIFEEHRRDIMREAKGVLSRNNLQMLEKSYNTLMEQRYEALKQLFNNDKLKFDSIISLLISSLSEKFSSSVIEEILEGLRFENDSLVYKPTGKHSRIRSGKGGKSSVPSLNWAKKRYANGKATTIQERDVMKIIKYIDSLKAYISELNRNSPDIKTLDQIKNDLIIEINNMDKAKKIQQDLNGQVSIDGIIYIAAQRAQYYRNQIEDVRFKYVDAEQITQELQAEFAEFLGNLSATELQRMSIEEAEKAVYSALQIGGKSRARQISDMPQIARLNQKAISVEYHKEQNNTDLNKLTTRQKKTFFNGQGKEKVVWEYSLEELGADVQGKRDIDIKLEGQTLGISMKNTDLSKIHEITIKGEKVQPGIQLQSSSLLLFFAGAQAYSGNNLGNHYLNIFAKHEHEPSLAIKMRAQAARAMSLYILFSAMTGRGQLRAGQEADILAIYDKNPKAGVRVRLFDMYDIMCRLDQEGQRYGLTPDMRLLTLKNDWDKESSSGRIAKVLYEARVTNIIASLSHQFLNDIIKDRGF